MRGLGGLPSFGRGSTTLGFQGTWTSSDTSPTSFSVNGVTCT